MHVHVEHQIILPKEDINNGVQYMYNVHVHVYDHLELNIQGNSVLRAGRLYLNSQMLCDMCRH